MNVGYEDDELKPYIEPEPDFNDARRMGKQGEWFLCYTVDSNFFFFFSFCNILTINFPSLCFFNVIACF